MIKLGNIEITARYYGSIPIKAVYYGTHLVWQAIRSCFGNGYWVNNMPWKNDEAWRNN